VQRICLLHGSAGNSLNSDTKGTDVCRAQHDSSSSIVATLLIAKMTAELHGSAVAVMVLGD
jgi:hypothetical protein